MTKKVARLGILFITSLFLGIAVLFVKNSNEPQMAKVHMLNIGQGDSFLVETENGAQILIDGGRDATVLSELGKVMSFSDKKIDVVVATHPDADHIGGLVDVINRYKVGLFLTGDVYSDTDLYKSLLKSLKDKKVPSYFVRAGMKLELNTEKSESFSILFPDRDTHNFETNTASVVGRLQLGKRSILFTGDSPISIEKYLVNKNSKDLDVDILKLGHHGSKTSTSKEYLRATSPDLALISAGVNNTYGHPNKEVLNLLKSFNIPYISTQISGTVTLETDGIKWYRK